MVGNFDQTWTLSFTPRRKSLQMNHFCSVKSPHMRRLRHNIERCLGLPLTEAMGSDPVMEVKPAAISGGCVAHAPVDMYRTPHTCTTLSWNDGDLGRLYVTCRNDHLSEAQRIQLNKDHCVWGKLLALPIKKV